MGEVFSNSQLEDKELCDITEQALLMSDGKIVIGIVLHPATKLWQTWVSLSGSNITCLTAHNQRYESVLVALDIAMAWKSGNLNRQADVRMFLQSLPSDGVVGRLPQEVVIKLSKLIKKSFENSSL